MDEALLEYVTEQVLRRMEHSRPAALLIGTAPREDSGYRYVAGPPWDAVVIGSLTPAGLLKMPCDSVCRAFLEGKPVYFSEEGLEYRRYAAGSCRPLYGELMAAERRLRQYGAKPLGEKNRGRILSAAEVRAILARGGEVPAQAAMTPLARDVLEGKK